MLTAILGFSRSLFLPEEKHKSYLLVFINFVLSLNIMLLTLILGYHIMHICALLKENMNNEAKKNKMG